MCKQLFRPIIDPGRYLARIGLDHAVTPDLDGLNRLIRGQLTHVPFEALDVWGAGVCPSLEIDDLYRKIVVDGRGGYCFELNTLFRCLLNTLGFEAYQVIASLLDENGNPAPPAHNVIICIVDGKKYLVDVGFGGPVPFGAMLLEEGEDTGFVLKRQGSFYALLRVDEGKLMPMIRFRDISAEPVELIPLNFYISQNPDSHFRAIPHVNQRFADGSVHTLIGSELRVRIGGSVSTRQIRNMSDLKEVLKTHFHIKPGKVKLPDNL